MKKRAIILALILLAGCGESMDEQNRMKTYGSSDGIPAWPGAGEAVATVPGTVAQDDPEYARQVATPPPVSLALVQRGHARYDIYCAMCHGLTGDGDGIVVARGFPKPKPLNAASQRAMSAPRMIDVISNGSGIMYGFSDRVTPPDRWAIVAYIRALQLAAGDRTPP